MNRFMINDYAGECLALLFLAWFSAEDIRDRRLSLTELSGSLLLGMLYLTLTGGLDDGKLPYRMLPGLFLLLLAYLTSEQVGYGDGLAVLILGCFLGARLLPVVVLREPPVSDCDTSCDLAYPEPGDARSAQIARGLRSMP